MSGDKYRIVDVPGVLPEGQRILRDINNMIAINLPSELRGSVSDGYHTFNELYEHRFELWIALCRATDESNNIVMRLNSKGILPPTIPVWRSRKHSDSTNYPGWFVLGVGTEKGNQITYHLPDRLWDRCKFAITREEAPEFDGHTSQDVLERLKTL